MSEQEPADKGPVGQQSIGRPTTAISIEQFKTYCQLQCTLLEIASCFDCSEATIERFCQDKFKMTFAESFKAFRGKGLMSLRRKQWTEAQRDNRVLMKLCEHHLNQKQSIELFETQVQPIILKYSVDEKKAAPGEDKTATEVCDPKAGSDTK